MFQICTGKDAVESKPGKVACGLYIEPANEILRVRLLLQSDKREVRLTIHEKSKQKLKDTIRRLLSRSPKTSIESVKQLLAQKLRGWMNYFQLAHAQRWTQGVDRWIRRRIR
ncbi:group II intron maturase-specific domain-containing protein [Parasutterella excrementihominis]|uniref:Group II intron maturase-specific domain-containing protein n=1 Tax=Parasutterella excrementihominis TaxID=487175 RepID=A0A6I3S0B3_9BURK|nr:hypothetical protein [Parasutterella excrementihominis]MTT73339.1 hypothetical protein [Parasutterella excrementihominis]MTT93419.1 hypothetical protein [Parasutterella excrementihominis]MTT96498.1 hypothetical protein [Parasutterella excrementihominis]MTU01249.1 hypothetical protein [Parasutterella excrementihominis]